MLFQDFVRPNLVDPRLDYLGMRTSVVLELGTEFERGLRHRLMASMLVLPTGQHDAWCMVGIEHRRKYLQDATQGRRLLQKKVLQIWTSAFALAVA